MIILSFPSNMRITSNVLEMHPQILKDKLRINKFIHKYFNPSIYERQNMKAIKTIMKLDKDQSPESKPDSHFDGYEGDTNLYEPFPRNNKGFQEEGRKRKERSVNVNRPPTLAHQIVNNFHENFNNEENFIEDYKYLERK